MTIKTQKALCLIPIVNIVPFIYFSFTSLRYSLKIKDFIKFMILIFGSVFGIALVRILISIAFDNIMIDTLFTILSFYIVMGSMSWFAIRFQEKIRDSQN